MSLLRIVLTTCLCAGILSAVATAQPVPDVAAVPGKVAMRILAPSGQPAANVDVWIGSAERRFRLPGETSLDTHATSDSDGKAVMAWPAGFYGQMEIRVKGIGYGYTGAMQVMSGKQVEAILPPLAPGA